MYGFTRNNAQSTEYPNKNEMRKKREKCLINYSADMAAHGGSILEDLKTWEIILQKQALLPHTGT